MTQPKHSMDGFVPRRPGGQATSRPQMHAANRFNAKQAPLASEVPRRQLGNNEIVRSELDESLRGIDIPEEAGKKGKIRGRKGQKSRLRRILKWVLIVLVVVGLAVGGYLIYKTLNAGNQIFKGSLLDIVQNQPLKEDANGRSNILILGTSEDDPGHEGASLTDSIMVLSVDQDNKNAYMMNLPRDMEVKYGMACNAGYQGRINEYFGCVGGITDNIEERRMALTKAAGFVGGILGMDIQYGVNVNYTVMRELVAALGTITVTIESRDPRGQMDSNFDWKCGVGDRKVSRAEVLRRCPPSGHFIDYPNGPVELDAEHALYLAQARGDRAPTYGFEQSNFDREKNQQKIVKAIREKALSAGVLTDFTKVSGILDALGNNLRTTFEAKEIRTLVLLAKDIPSDSIQSISFIDAEPPLMDGNGEPTAGSFQFGAIQAYLKKKLSPNPVVREEAKIVVLNGSGVVGVGQKEADKLTADGFTIAKIANAPAGTYGDIEVYQVGDGMTATKEKLASLYGVEVKATTPPGVIPAGTNFVVIFGKDRSASQ